MKQEPVGLFHRRSSKELLLAALFEESSWVATSHSASQETHDLYGSSRVLLLRQMNPNILASCLLNIDQVTI